MPKRLYNVWLSPEVIDAIKTEARRKGQTQAEFVRRALLKVLPKSTIGGNDVERQTPLAD